jgi:predicted nucleic-acid-binding protein
VIGLDTNVALRMLLADDPGQTAAVRKLSQTLSPERPGFINLIVLAEFIWVLQTGYRFSKPELIEAVEFLLSKPDLRVDRESLVREAVTRFQEGQSDLADLLIGLVNQAAGCETTYTFDRRAGKLGEMSLA